MQQHFSNIFIIIISLFDVDVKKKVKITIKRIKINLAFTNYSI